MLYFQNTWLENHPKKSLKILLLGIKEYIFYLSYCIWRKYFKINVVVRFYLNKSTYLKLIILLCWSHDKHIHILNIFAISIVVYRDDSCCYIFFENTNPILYLHLRLLCLCRSFCPEITTTLSPCRDVMLRVGA